MRIAIVGATGLVGNKMIRQLESSGLPVEVCIPVASSRSYGKKLQWKGSDIEVVGIEQALAMKPHLALFSCGSEASLEYAPMFAGSGCRVIDNSSAWRRKPDVPLVVPEVNPDAVKKEHMIIANPNCSTIQLVVVLRPLQHNFGIKRVVVSTYQSVSGSGIKGLRQLADERAGIITELCYPYSIDLNVIPQGGGFLPGGITTEEDKLIFETRKIMNLPKLAISATVVRVPVNFSHCESVNVEFPVKVTPSQIIEVLEKAPGIIVEDNPAEQIYPMPVNVTGRDEVFVGRVRQDASLETAADMWIVADNVLKGAATNAVQIAKLMYEGGLI